MQKETLQAIVGRLGIAEDCRTRPGGQASSPDTGWLLLLPLVPITDQISPSSKLQRERPSSPSP